MTEPDRRSGLFTGLVAVAVGIAVAGAAVAWGTEVADYGINDTSSRDKDITAVVRVTFALD